MLWFRRRILLWVVVVIGLPLTARALHEAADAIESRLGPTPVVGGLHAAGKGAERLSGHLRRPSQGSRLKRAIGGR